MERKLKFKELYRLMKENNINQKQLAEMLNVNPVNLQCRLYGMYEFRMKEIKFLLHYFGKTYDELFPEIED